MSQTIINQAKSILSNGKNTLTEQEAADKLSEARQLVDNYLYADIAPKKELGKADFSLKSRVQKPWVSTIVIALAEFNDCVATTEGGKRSNLRYCFKGCQQDAELSVLMLSYLIDACDAMYEDCKGLLGLSGLADKNDFYKAMAIGLKKRIADKLESRNAFLCADDARGVLNNEHRKTVSSTYGRTMFTTNQTTTTRKRRVAKNCFVDTPLSSSNKCA